MKKVYKSIITILPFLVFIILGYIVNLKVDEPSNQQSVLILYAPYVILLLAAVLSWWFNRSRSFFMLVVLICSLLTLHYQDRMFSDPKDFYALLNILIPVNVIALSFMKERGIISIWGALRFGLIILQASFIDWIIETKQLSILNQINHSILPVNLSPIIKISQMAFLLFVLAFIILIIRVILYQSSQDFCFISILISLFYMLNADKIFKYSISFIVIGLILIYTILKDAYSMAFYDELTRLPSRRALNQDMMKLGMKYSIAMIDIDSFKKFNDLYGHDTGDEVLRFIASMMKEVKGGGKAYRYGGEEFTIIFPGKVIDDIMPVVENLREAIAKRGFIIRRKRTVVSTSKNKARHTAKRGKSNTNNIRKVFIHVSIGVAQKDEAHNTTAMVLKAADTALYRAKKKGKNCVSK